MNFDDVEKFVVRAIYWVHEARPDLDMVTLRSNDTLLKGITKKELFDAINRLDNFYNIIHIEDIIGPPDIDIYKISIMHEESLVKWAKELETSYVAIGQGPEVISYKDLAINLRDSTLSYGPDITIGISPATQTIQFLMLLIKNSEKLLTYVELAKVLNLNAYHEGVEISVLRDALKFIKRDLKKYLIDNHLSKEAATQIVGLIKAKRNSGYILQG